MIIDVHYHLMPKLSEKVVRNLAKSAVRMAQGMGKTVDPEDIFKQASEFYPDPAGEHLISIMDESGIDLTLICMVDNVTIPQLKPENMQRGNKIIGDISQKNPGRVMALAGVDPRRPEAPDMLKQCFEEFGVRGLKYHPDDGYDPCGPDSYKLLEVLMEYNGILLTHTGPLGPPSRCKYAEPMLLADLAVDFPDLQVIAAHMGMINWRPWAALAAHQPNLYGDMAMWDHYAFTNYNLFCRELRDLIDYAGISKVLFGTDNPIPYIIEPTKNWIDLLKDLPDKAPNGIVFTREEIDAILGGNA
ncbi:MAG: amidohydrolase family protein, partial [Deltaproteobacteria bacterium]|nr:amidohydrolase family protein [Deltaproteobacteria bacterium]MBW2324377.1 amidohydrolase family protein [Deltaproteobacteria bacterium]